MTVYLDHAATTPIPSQLLTQYCETLQNDFGNPASAHGWGRRGRDRLEASRALIGELLACPAANVTLTSGGTESINWALRAFPRRYGRLITSQGEHPATLATAAALEQDGWQIERVPLLPNGQVNLDKLAQALREPADLLSLIWVSNETGAINPISQIVALRDQLAPRLPLHLDAVQAIGKVPVILDGSGIDLISASGHKFGAPKGIGLLATRPKLRLMPLIHGGGQQRGLRSGTENPPLAAILAAALRIAISEQPARQKQAESLRALLLQTFRQRQIPGLKLSPEDGVPEILTWGIPGINGETLVRALDQAGFGVSAGSACAAAHKQKVNPVLLAMGLPEPLAAGAFRVSTGCENTPDDMLQFTDALAQIVKRLLPARR